MPACVQNYLQPCNGEACNGPFARATADKLSGGLWYSLHYLMPIADNGGLKLMLQNVLKCLPVLSKC